MQASHGNFYDDRVQQIVEQSQKNRARVEAIDSKDKVDLSKSDVDHLEALRERLEKRLDDAQFLNAAILEKCSHDDNELENEINLAEEFEERIQCQLKAVERILSQFDEPDTALAVALAAPAVSTPSTISSTIKMPKFNLPKFNGNYKEWIPFHEQFCASVDRNATFRMHRNATRHSEIQLSEIVAHRRTIEVGSSFATIKLKLSNCFEISERSL